MDAWCNISKLLEDWHNDELYEPSLSTGNVCGCSITHHRDVKTLSLLHISLIKEFVEKQVCPLSAQVEWSQRSTDIASVQCDTGD